VRKVPIAELEATWPKVNRWIESAVRYGQGDEDACDICIAIYNGIYQLWHEPDKFAAVVQIVEHPRQTVATILYCGGELDSLLTMYAEAKHYARANGIDAIRVWGRQGWEKVLGMKRIGVILQEQL
jgi:hypothetical protein